MCCLVTYYNNRIAYRIDGIDGELLYLLRNSIKFESGKGDIWIDPKIYYIVKEPGVTLDGLHVRVYRIERSGSVSFTPLKISYYKFILGKSSFHYKPNKREI